MKVAYQHVDVDGRFVFHTAAGGEQVVEGSGRPYVTDDNDVIVYLDQTPFVKRVKAGSGADA
jgi:hypothetical protein